MKKITQLIVTISCILSMPACRIEPAADIHLTDDSCQTEYRFSTVLLETKTKSLYSSSEEDTVKDALIAIYTEEGALLRIVSPEQGINLNNDVKYSFYVLTGDLTSESIPSKESTLISLRHKYGMNSFSSYHERWKSIPMAARVIKKTPHDLDLKDGKEDGRITFAAERLFAKLSLKVEYDDYIKKYFTVSVNSVRVVNMANSVSPFDSSLNYPEDVVPAEADFAIRPEPNGKYLLYIPENRQGTLLPGNNKPSGKNESAILSSGHHPERCTYIEASVSYSSTFGVSGKVLYRFYPGNDNTSNFDLVRNTGYDITMSLHGSSLGIEASWKIDTEGLDDSRTLSIESSVNRAYPGEYAFIRCNYKEAGIDKSSDRLSQIPGYSVGTDLSAYLSGTSYPITSSYIGYDAVCKNCGEILRDYPRNDNSYRQSWMMTVTGGPSCPSCGKTIVGSDGTLSNVSFSSTGNLVLLFPISPSASPGEIISFHASTHDGWKQADASVTIEEKGSLTIDTSHLPKYLAMTGYAEVLSLPSGVKSIGFKVTAGENIIKLTQDGMKCIISATNTGIATVAVINKSDSSVIGTFEVTINLPRLSIDKDSYTCSPDGTTVPVTSSYYDTSGSRIPVSDFDGELYSTLLKPILSTDSFWLYCDDEGVRIAEIDDIPLGRFLGQVKVSAIGCKDITPDTADVYCLDPFGELDDSSLLIGRIDDYSLIETGQEFKQIFNLKGKINASSFTVYGAKQEPTSKYPTCMSFSIPGDNDRNLTIRWSSSGDHAHGKVNVIVQIFNSFSGISLERCIGYVEIYLHSIVGCYAYIKPDKWSNGDAYASVCCTTVPGNSDTHFKALRQYISSKPVIYNDMSKKTSLWKLNEFDYYYKEENDWNGICREASNEADRPYLTHYEDRAGASGGIGFTYEELYRVYPGLIDTHYGRFSSAERWINGGEMINPIRIDFTQARDMLLCVKDENGFPCYGYKGAGTDSSGVPYLQIGISNTWIGYEEL